MPEGLEDATGEAKGEEARLMDQLPQPARPETANEKLALQIAEALCAAGLVAPASKEEVRRKLASGGASAADWKTWVTAVETGPRERQDA